MKIALIGASGFVGSAILKEALSRQHQVTAVMRHPEKLTMQDERLAVVPGDVMDTDQLTALLKGNDVVICAYNAGWTNPNLYNDFLEGSQSIQKAVKSAGIKRLIVIGGAGSLYAAPEKQVVDLPGFPEAWKPGALAARDYLNLLKNEKELDWTFVSPAVEMNPANPGKREGRYRTGLDNPVQDEQGRSYISVADLAVAVLDEAEQPKHIGQRFTVAY